MADEEPRSPRASRGRTLLRSITSRLPFIRNRLRREEMEVEQDAVAEEELPPLVEDMERDVPAAIAAQLQNNNNEEEQVAEGEQPPAVRPPRRANRTIVFTFESTPSIIFVATGDFTSSASVFSLLEMVRNMNFDDVLNESFLQYQRQHGGAAPATEEQLGAIQERPVKEDEVGELCPVCQENMTCEDKAIKLPCSHLFHPDCGLTWLKQHNSCPLCRAPLAEESASV